MSLNKVNKSSKKNIINHFDELAKDRKKWIKKSAGFYSEDILSMKELVPKGSKVLEIGCGTGHLLNALEPSYGVGIDISSKMISCAQSNYENLKFINVDIEEKNSLGLLKEDFDFIIISDTIGYFSDIQKTFSYFHKFCNSDTRIIVAYYSPFWKPLLNIAASLKLKMP